jgi:hypothetical protein
MPQTRQERERLIYQPVYVTPAEAYYNFLPAPMPAQLHPSGERKRKLEEVKEEEDEASWRRKKGETYPCQTYIKIAKKEIMNGSFHDQTQRVLTLMQEIKLLGMP